MKNRIAAGLLLVAASGSIVLAQTNAPAEQASIATEEPELTREMFLEDDVAPRVQPAAYDTTIVMYTDYQCPYCRKAHVALTELLKKDRKVRILYRDWPIFGPASEQAARLAIASKWQGKHAEFHDALMRTPGKLSDSSIRAAATKAGVDWARLQRDLKAHEAEISALLERNNVQAEALGLSGTPGFIIGNTFAPGGVDLAGFKELLKESRAAAAGGKVASAGGSR